MFLRTTMMVNPAMKRADAPIFMSVRVNFLALIHTLRLGHLSEESLLVRERRRLMEVCIKVVKLAI